MRGKLGESLASVQKYDVPVENVTTPSLEALKAYTLGQDQQYVKEDYVAEYLCSSGPSASIRISPWLMHGWELVTPT